MTVFLLCVGVRNRQGRRTERQFQSLSDCSDITTRCVRISDEGPFSFCPLSFWVSKKKVDRCFVRKAFFLLRLTWGCYFLSEKESNQRNFVEIGTHVEALPRMSEISVHWRSAEPRRSVRNAPRLMSHELYSNPQTRRFRRSPTAAITHAFTQPKLKKEDRSS